MKKQKIKGKEGQHMQIKNFDNHAFAQRLKQLRMANNYTQQDIADQFGIDRSTYTVYENEKARMSLERVYKLAQFYDVPVGYLLAVEDYGNAAPSGLSDPQPRVASCDEAFLTMTDEEQDLIRSFRLLDKQGREEALRLVGSLLSNQISPSDE